MKKVNIILILLACLVNSCNGQKSDIKECKEHFSNAKKEINLFYNQQNEKGLAKALEEVELSQNCSETRKASIELKISILSLQKNYSEAIKFINTLNTDDFKKPYKKSMQINFFKALNCEYKENLEERDLHLKKAINNVESFVKNQKSIDQEAYYDLFLIKSKLLTKKEIDLEINELENKYPSEKSFFEILKETFNEDIKKINSK